MASIILMKNISVNILYLEILVPWEGIEPSQLASLVPKTSVYTNFTTTAHIFYSEKLIRKRLYQENYKDESFISFGPTRAIFTLSL